MRSTTIRASSHAFLVTLFAVVTSVSCANGGAGDPGGHPTGGGGGGGGLGGGFGDAGALGPETCEDAAKVRSYVGCDYWPTPVANLVWSVFDFAVVIANAQNVASDVTVTGPQGFKKVVTVEAGALAKIYLPWVPELKGGDSTECGGRDSPWLNSVRVPKSAYHLVSTRPVVVYQFNALEYKPAGGPASKNWSACPGTAQSCYRSGGPVGCFSYSNDASLLLPSTALTGTYRVTGTKSDGRSLLPTYFAVTGTQDGTTVTVNVSKYGKISGGGGIPSTDSGGTVSFKLDAGDVAELVGHVDDRLFLVYSSDLSGSLVHADKPVQVITGVQCIGNPVGSDACDHLEESVFPAETLGRDYFVTVPTGPKGKPMGHTVRLYGNFDGTTLTYDPAPPPNAPTTLQAGEVVDLGSEANQNIVETDFRVQGSQPFAVATFMLGASHVSPGPSKGALGDPSQSLPAAVAQYRTNYLFLAPDDYDVSYVDVVAPLEATLTLDGASVSAAPTAIGSSGFGLRRITLGPGNAGAHTLAATKPVGIQVMGYGVYTSYQYPGGSDFVGIAPTPIR